MAPLCLRRSGPQDATLLRHIYASTRQVEMGLLGWTDEQSRAFLEMQFSAQDQYYRLHYPDADYAIVEWNGQAIGRFYLLRRTDNIHIIDIALLPEYRRRGFGRQLLQQTQEEAKQIGASLSLQVAHDNPARNLYALLGFLEISSDGMYSQLTWRAE